VLILNLSHTDTQTDMNDRITSIVEVTYHTAVNTTEITFYYDYKNLYSVL